MTIYDLYNEVFTEFTSLNGEMVKPRLEVLDRNEMEDAFAEYSFSDSVITVMDSDFDYDGDINRTARALWHELTHAKQDVILSNGGSLTLLGPYDWSSDEDPFEITVMGDTSDVYTALMNEYGYEEHPMEIDARQSEDDVPSFENY